MLSYWATFNGLIIDGLAFAALTGIRTGNKELVEKIYDGKLHMARFSSSDEDLEAEEKQYVRDRINTILTEKMHYIIGFAMSAIGTFGSIWVESDMPITKCQKRLELLIAMIMWWVVAYALKYIFVKLKMWEIKKDIKNGKISIFAPNDIVCRTTVSTNNGTEEMKSILPKEDNGMEEEISEKEDIINKEKGQGLITIKIENTVNVNPPA